MLWQRQWLEAGALAEGLAYWTQQLEGIPKQLALPTDRPRPPAQTFDAEACHVVLTGEQSAALGRLNAEKLSTLYMALLAALGVLLARYSGQDDIVVGSPIANPSDVQLEQLIVFFVNNWVKRVRVDPDSGFGDLLADVRATALEAYRYPDVPFERLVEVLAPQRSLNRSPIFKVDFALQNEPRTTPALDGLQVKPI